MNINNIQCLGYAIYADNNEQGNWMETKNAAVSEQSADNYSNHT